MDPTRFESERFGVVRNDDAKGFSWFDPSPLPLDIELSRSTVNALSQADDALGRLAGVGRLLRNKDTLVRLYSMKEALASSRIEGTQAELQTAFQADAKPQMRSRFPEAGTVLSVYSAIEHGMAEVRDAGQISIKLALSVHARLMRDDFGGSMRDQAVWVGSPTDRPQSADYVPPVPERLDAALAAWEHFAQSPSDLPPLIRAAMLHYQFLTIHPFRDGNGRVARILVPLFLAAEDRLPEPLLYLSPYFEAKRRRYYDRLQIVRERGDIEQWIQFFLTAVEAQARDGVVRGERLLDLMDHYREELAGSRSRSIEVVDLLFEHAVISAAIVRDALDISHQGALNLIRGLEKRGWLVASPATGRGGAKYWFAVEVIDAVERDLSEQASPVHS